MKNTIEIIPAIIADNQKDLEGRVNKVRDFVKIIQLDFMDNSFVPNKSLWFDFVLPPSNVVFEAHLMVKKPMSWIEKHLNEIDIFLIHYECDDDLDETIDLVRDADRSVGLVINPETPVENIIPYIDRLDQVLVMTVTPGFYGSPFLPDMLEKVRYLRSEYPYLELEVDGGITKDTISQAALAGANKFVSGSFIVKSDDPQKAINQLLEASEL